MSRNILLIKHTIRLIPLQCVHTHFHIFMQHFIVQTSYFTNKYVNNVVAYRSSTGPVELDQDNQSDVFTGYLHLSVVSVVQAWVPLGWHSNDDNQIKESRRTILKEESFFEGGLLLQIQQTWWLARPDGSIPFSDILVTPTIRWNLHHKSIQKAHPH